MGATAPSPVADLVGRFEKDRKVLYLARNMTRAWPFVIRASGFLGVRRVSAMKKADCASE
jgi:hypothetical protein